MILCALRNVLRVEGFDELSQGLHRLIERPDINNTNQYVLQTETSYPYLQEHIQSLQPPTAEPRVGDEERRLQDAFMYLGENLSVVARAVRQNPALSDEKKREQIKRELLRIRSTILKLKVIVITLENEEDAYVIFETLNTRGKDLTVSDLVRTHITRLLPQSNRNVDRPKERFNAIVESFEASEADISVNSFLHHYWLSHHDFTTEKKLYKAVKKRIKSKDSASEFLDSLESDAALYRVLHEPDARKWEIEKRPIREALHAMNLFRVRQQIPFVLSVLCEYEEGRLPLKHAIRALRAVENFHFAFTAVTSQRSSGGVSLMYALHARELRNAATLRDKIRTISDLIDKLQGRRPDYQEFKADFRTILCSNKFTKRKALVQYILGKIQTTSMSGVALDPSRMTIEHIACQSSAGSEIVTDEQVAEIGNLILVTEGLNGRLGSKSFKDKMAILRKSRVWLDESLKTATSWGPTEVRCRTDALAKLAYEKFWRI